MEDITMLLNSVCVVTVISGAILVIIPENKLTNAYKSVVAIIMIYFFASALVGVDFKSGKIPIASVYDRDEMEKLYENNIISTAESLLTDEIIKILSDNGFDCDAEIKISSDGESINKIIKISDFEDNTDKKRVYELLTDRFDGDVIIEFSG